MNFDLYNISLINFGDKLHFENVYWLDFAEANVSVFYTIINDASVGIVRHANICSQHIDSLISEK